MFALTWRAAASARRSLGPVSCSPWWSLRLARYATAVAGHQRGPRLLNWKSGTMAAKYRPDLAVFNQTLSQAHRARPTLDCHACRHFLLPCGWFRQP